MRRRTPSTRRSSGEASAGGRQRRKKEAQRIIRELHDDEYVGGGVPELHTLKSLTPSGLSYLILAYRPSRSDDCHPKHRRHAAAMFGGAIIGP